MDVAVHAPHETPSAFPWMDWRRTRRLLGEVLVALAQQTHRPDLAEWAAALEAEQLTMATAERLCAALGVRADEDLREVLGRALDRLAPGAILPDLANVDQPMVPDWDQIERSPLPVVFHGTVGAFTLGARLRPSRDLVVPYELTWLGLTGAGGGDDEHQVSPWDRAGWALGETAQVWDWLCIRRLIWLATHGYLVEPSADQWPLVLKLRQPPIVPV